MKKVNKITEILKTMEAFLLLSLPTNSSVKADRTHSTMENWEPNPRVAIMKKKKMAQSCGAGIRDRASGYTTNARPGPGIHR